MATIYENPTLAGSEPAAEGGSLTFQELDTRIPPRARPILDSISVNGVAIAEADILAEVQNHPADNPGNAIMEAARALVVRALLLQEAGRLGIGQAPQNDAGDVSQTREDAAIHALIEQEVVVPTATSEECRRYFDRNTDRFQSEPIYEARHILLGVASDDKALRARVRACAEALIAQLNEQPEQFGALAQQHSDCPSREQDGHLGQLTHGSTVPEFEKALQRMEEGALCPNPIESRFGFHVIQLDRRMPGEALPFELVQDRIAAWLDASAWSKAVSQYVSVLAGRAQIAGIDLNSVDSPLVQ
ncbi:MAG: peptidylprolyl isomerase [Alphaproteobacteria bacterium]|nr:peptidylprolyl isomerase [Alphaproteobacteria bacterium]